MTVKNLEAVLGLTPSDLPSPRFKRTARAAAAAALHQVETTGLEAKRRADEAAEQEQRRCEARLWQLTFNRLYPHQAVAV